MARRRQRHEEHPDERWLVTYADVLTLMFVLFMVLFSISVVNTSKFEVLKESLQDAFNAGLAAGGTSVLESPTGTPAPAVDALSGRIAPDLPTLGGIALGEATPAQMLETSQLEAAERAIEGELERAGLSDRVSLAVNERGLAVRLTTDGVLFDSGEAVLRSEGARVLAPIAASLRGLPNPIRVEGHTDDSPIATARFPSNWDLSAIRSSAVVRTMVSARVPDTRIQVAAYGDTRPIADNGTAAGRSANRRVEIYVLRLQGAPGQPPAAVGG